MTSNDDFSTDMVGRRALSKEGHAAISMRGGDDRWIQIQKNTFTNWVNEQLREREAIVEDLQFDFTDGTKLCYLVESLQEKKIKGKIVPNPLNQHQMLHNAGMALTAISDDNVKLVNIGPEDIVNGNLKLILGLIWHLILRYQIGKTKFPPKKLMLAWLQAVIPDCQVGNFTRDWNDGVALHALLDYCKPGLAPDWRKLNRNNKVENCRNAMELAKQHFDIPLVLRPEDLSSPDLDELSGMTYLSYYMKYDSPGYRATLNWVRNAIPDADVNNFTTDWNDGKALCKLVRKMGGSCSPNPQGTPVENLQAGIDAGKRLGVDPILSAKELSEASEEHLGNMAYAASFNHLKPSKPPSEKVALSGDFKNVVVGNEKNFGLVIQDGKVNPRDLRAELEGPNSKIPVRLDWKGNVVDGHFRPKEAGNHRLVVYCQDEVISSCPVNFPVLADPNRVIVHKADRTCLGVPTELKIDTSSAGQGDVTVEAISPNGRRFDLPLSSKNGMFHSAFTPSEPGDWKINVTYAGEHVRGSPYTVNVYDPNAVKVYGLEGGAVGKAFNFTADCSQAGEGNLDVTVTHNGMTVPAKIIEDGYGVYKVDFVPHGAGLYKVQVLFNENEVKGSPYTLEIVDSNLVTASGEGLSLVPVNKVAAFTIDTKSAGGGDVNVDVVGPDGRDLPVRVKESVDGYRVEWTPNSVGEHKVYVSYAEIQLKGSPYTPRVYDPSGVVVRHEGHGKINKPVPIHLDAAKAGAGNLEIFVTTSKGETVPNFVRQEGDAKYEVTFTPQSAENHNVTVNFNGDPVPGSPFPCKITDNSRVHVSGDGLRLVPANVPTSFKVDPQTSDPGECTVDIIAPSGRHIPNRITGGHGTPFRVEYTPTETGQYAVRVMYDETEVKGSPFTSDVYNPDLVHITNKPKAYLNKPVIWEVDASKAGPGSLDVDLKCRGAAVRSNIREISPGRYEVSFTPREHTTHSLSLLYNGDTITGSPHHVDIIDSSQVSLSGEALRTAQVYKESYFEVDPHGPLDEEIKAVITGPSGGEIPCRISRRGNIYRVDFTPHEVGPHNIETLYAGMAIAGGPATCMTYDPSLVRITDVDKTGRLEREIGFIVDASAAGEGEVETTVTHYGRMVRTWRENVGTSRYRYIFVPTEPGPYDIDVRFNNERIPGSPLLIQVEEEKPTTIRINFQGVIAFEAHKKSQFLLEMDGKNVNPNDLDVLIRAPNGEQIPARIVPQTDGDYRVEWTPTIPGRYTIEVSFGGRKIQGSPFYVDVFDISRIRVENIRYGNVGEGASFDVDYSQAGKAEHTVRVVGPSGQHIPAEVQERNGGQHVRFDPHEPGRYKIYVTFGGMDVPGSPFMIDVDEGRMPTANGDGLFHGEEDRPATFYVDARGLRGELGVQVEGPNSIAKCNIEPERDGVYAVTYVPVEVGKYRAVVKWNGKEIPSSPFHPKVVDPRKVKVVGGWQHYMDVNNRVQLLVNEEKRIPFDVSEAGPGLMTAEVRGPGGKIPCRIEESHHKRTVCFTPREEGDHHIYAYWSDHTLVNAPFHGYAVGRRRSPDPTKVVLSGRGLKEAVVHREAEFQIDGSEAGPGRPEVKLEGVKRNVPVRVSSLGNGRYRCTYTPESSGAFLLHINWNERQLRGSPFKVHVINAHYPQKVVVSGEGLKGGVMGRDINVIIDTRKAGPGELTAHCMGPHKVAYCELEDMRDGTYKLNIRPQEPGRHILQIKYGGEHVLGSPYVLRVGAQPDASKVRVYGPGVENSVLATFQSRFIVETKGAGAGQLTVRIRGPKGAFQVEMLRDSQKDRTIMCRFDPSETGLYQVFVKWSGVDVPGSPFHVYIVDTEADLRHIQQGQIPPQFQPSTLNRSIYNSDYSTWREDDGYRM